MLIRCYLVEYNIGALQLEKERKKYNNEYWSAHGHKYVKKRSTDNEYNQNKVNIIENTGKDINIYIKIIFFMLHH